jgi:hypothetical protein
MVSKYWNVILPESLFSIWLRGFGILILQVSIIALPGILPIVGDRYLLFITKYLGVKKE